MVRRDRSRIYPSRQAFAAAAGVKKRTIDKIETGEPGGYRDHTKDGVERALRWTSGSFDTVASGGQPSYVTDPDLA